MDIEAWRKAIIDEAQTEEAAKHFIEQLTTTDWSLYTPCAWCRKNVGSQNLALPPVAGWEKHNGLKVLCPDCLLGVRESTPYDCLYCKKWYGNWTKPPDEFGLCGICCEQFATEINQVKEQNARAKACGVVHTLTAMQWIATLQHFDYLCVYCANRRYACMEHFLPISLNGGTTAENCLPSCSRCNARKRNKLPEEFACFFPVENMTRIQAYFASVA